MPTIVDVAELSGVSKSTVSNVVRGADHLSEKTKQKVLAAIEELGYSPNALARDLRSRHTAAIGLVVGDLRNPYYSELARLIEGRCVEAGYSTIICDTDGIPERERERMNLLLQQRVAGMLMLHFSGNKEETVQLVESAGVPIVAIGILDKELDSISQDDVQGAELAVAHLVELGHTRIAYLPSPYPEQATTAARLRGARRTMKEMGVGELEVLEMGLADDEGYREQLRDRFARSDRPTAVFAGNDITALGLIDQLEEFGLLVPRDVSVVGFDDIQVSSLRRLSLTTVKYELDELVAVGVARLLERIRSKDEPHRALRRRLVSELVVRASTGPPS